MSESSDYRPSSYSSSHDFHEARSTYRKHADRSYAEAKSANVQVKDLIPTSISTKCKRPLILVDDQTGSMEEWPATLFSKFPYLEFESKVYLGQDLEFCFMANGDARNGETYPLQVRPFVKEKAIAEKLKELVIEKKGGGNGMESYELPALYCLHNVKMPDDAKPILIFIGDEGLYDEVTVDDAREYVHVRLNDDMPVKELFSKLKKKYAVYIIRKRYPNNEASVNAQWVSLLGKDHVANLDDPNRVVDVIFGILATETGQWEYFEEEFEERQKDNPEYFPIVYGALKNIHARSEKVVLQKRPRAHNEEEGKEAKPLI